MEETRKISQMLMWIQASSTSKDDIIILDGENINKVDERYIGLSQIAVRTGKSYKPLINNGSLHVQKSQKGTYLIMSNFEEVDEVGRKIAYSAKIKTKSLAECINVLEDNIKPFNYHIKKEDIEMITNFHEPDDKKKMVLTLLVILFAIYLIIKVLHNYGN